MRDENLIQEEIRRDYVEFMDAGNSHDWSVHAAAYNAQRYHYSLSDVRRVIEQAH